MPKWTKPKEDKTNILLPLLFFILGGYFFLLSVVSYLNAPEKIISTINVMSTFLLLIYLGGRLFGQLYSHRDYIELEAEGIKFRQTPSFDMGWLPIEKYLKFNEIEKIDMVQVSHLFSPDKKTHAILIVSKSGKSYAIGSYLTQDQIFKLGMAMKGSVAISSTLQKFLGQETTVKDVIDKAKAIWSTIREKRE